MVQNTTPSAAGNNLVTDIYALTSYLTSLVFLHYPRKQRCKFSEYLPR